MKPATEIFDEDTFRKAREEVSSVFDDLTETAGAAVDGIGSSIFGTFSDLGGSIMDIFADVGGNISDLMSGIMSAFSGSGGGGAGWAGLLSTMVAHTGAKRVGTSQTQRRSVPAAVFANAVRYHQGTSRVGLAPNEVPAILEKGERVLTERQADAMDAAERSGNREIALRNILVSDPSMLTDFMASSEGERTLMTVLRKNRGALRQIVG